MITLRGVIVTWQDAGTNRNWHGTDLCVTPCYINALQSNLDTQIRVPLISGYGRAWENLMDGGPNLSSIHQIFLHQFACPSTFPPSIEENNKNSSIILASIRISAIKWRKGVLVSVPLCTVLVSCNKTLVDVHYTSHDTPRITFTNLPSIFFITPCVWCRCPQSLFSLGKLVLQLDVERTSWGVIIIYAWGRCK